MPDETKPLSEREKDVARLLSQGKSNKQMALELGISSRTVEFHLRNIYAKLGAASRTEAILKLAERDLWKTPGAVPVESTVEKTSDPMENDSYVISWRIPMKKTYYVLGGLLLALLLVLGIVFDKTPQSMEATATPLEPTSTIQAERPTATVPVPTQTSAPEPERAVIPPHTVNGYTASIESYTIDVSHVIFQVRLTGKDLDPNGKLEATRLGNVNIYDEYGNLTNASVGMGPAADMESY